MGSEKLNVPQRRFKEFENTGAWEQRKLSQLGSVITGSTPSTQVQTYYSDIGIPWVTPTDISDNVTFRTAKHLTNEGQKVARVVPKNTILVTSIASIGKNTMLGTTGSFNQQINGLVPNEKENHPYFLFTESAIWSDKMKRLAASGTMQIVNKTEFSEINTYVPTLDEQKQIGECFQHLDNLITLHQRKLDKIQSMKKSYLSEMFPAEGETKPKRRFSGFTDDWEQRKLSDVSVVSTGCPFDSKDFSDDGTYLVITNGNIQDTSANVDGTVGNRITVSVDKALNSYLLDIGDVLVTMDGTVGRTAKVSENGQILAQRVGRLKATIDSEFLYQWLNTGVFSKAMMELSHGGTIKHISLDEIRSFVSAVPTDADEQKQIGEYFKYLDNLITLHQRKLEKLKNMKQAYLTEMFV